MAQSAAQCCSVSSRQQADACRVRARDETPATVRGYRPIVFDTNSVALVRERTIPTERPPRLAKLVPTFADRGVSRGQRNGSPRPLISVFWTGAATFSFK